MRKAFAIAGMNLRRLTRDRTGLFFFLVLPFLIVLALGAAFGSGFTPKLGVVASGQGELTSDLVARLEQTEDLDVVIVADTAALRDDVERGRLEGGLVIPETYDQRIMGGETVELEYFARPTGSGPGLGATVTAAIDGQNVAIRSARLSVQEGVQPDMTAALERASTIADSIPAVEVVATTAGGETTFSYSLDNGAAQEVVLFVFVTSLAASSMLIQSRKLGCTRRMFASPTPVATVLLGETLGRYLIALAQGIVIVVGTTILFQVEWGDPASALVIIAALAAVATGAAMLMGSILQNEQQAGSLGVFIGLGLAALGGAMVPLEVFPPTMERIAHLTPHAWAIEALIDLQSGSSLAEVAAQLTVLILYAAAILAVAVVLFRRTLVRAAR